MMRPPVQKSALQQNEANRLQHHQQTHKHLQQQKQLQQQPDIIATNFSDLQQTETIARKSKLEQRELLVENHLNSACFAQVHHQQPTTRQPPPPPPPVTARTIARKSLPTYYNDCYQQQQQQHPTPHLANSGGIQNNRRDSSATVKLLDLSTSPPSLNEPQFRNQTTTSAEVLQNRISSSNNTNNSQQRFSFASQYSSRSSSSDDSSSISLTTACASSAAASAEVGAGHYNTYNNTFDDAAENFIINFPADTSPLPAQPSLVVAAHSDYCLPLSETEPLLTNIESTVNDKQRSIYLNKNSASLIFTRKDLSTQTAAKTAAANTYQQQQKQQQFKSQSKTNNNFNGTPASLSSKSFPGTTSTATNNSGGPTNVRRQNHSTLRSFSEENYKRKPTKHLPATYHQQHRRSLQLNYNNNLVTTTTCGTHANNNHCCGGNSNSGISNSNSAVLHKTHHSNQQPLQRQQQQQQPLFKQQQQQGHHYQHCSLNSNTTNNTATATRKQYAYSWYAPVYSALEEELEQDSRDSSPIHNLANTKKQHINQYHQSHDLNSSLAPTTDNETEALLETRHNINIQAHLPANNLKKESITKQLHPAKLSLQSTRNPLGKGNHQATKGIGHSGGGDVNAVEGFSNYDLEGPHAGSLGLAGGPQPRRIRFGNFLKSLVGLRPSVSNRNVNGVVGANTSNSTANEPYEDDAGSPPLAIPSSPEITITRTPSEQNMVVMRDPSGYREYNAYSSREKLANFHRERVVKSGSTSSLNVMQQKLWNIMRREGSAISLHQEKSQSIVHYTGLRKCETVLALTRQTTSPCSPTMGAGAGAGVTSSNSRNHLSESHATRLSYTGSGIFSASGVEQIRPLNRLRNSISSMNNTCSRCSSLLSLAASSSRYSLNNTTNPMAHTSQQHLRQSSNISSSNISNTFSRSRDGSVETGLHFAVKRNSRTSALGSQRNSTSGANSTTSSRTPSITSPTTTTATTASTIKLTTPPTDNSLSVPLLSPPTTNSMSLTSTVMAPVLRESVSFPAESASLLKVANKKETSTIKINDEGDIRNVDYDVIDGVYRNNSNNTSGGSIINKPCSSSTSSSNSTLLPISQVNVTLSTNPKTSASTTITETAAVASTTTESIMATIMQHCNTPNDSLTPTTTPTATQAPPARPFEMFTCKLCLIDVENASNSTILHQCGCQFCTEVSYLFFPFIFYLCLLVLPLSHFLFLVPFSCAPLNY
ncbi:serine-rich adhesin for platelets-like [Lucilia sericata]|uniref:serine-rich adhesin for platelets-like n=1 Tax=Lucilia sericata TaxID=13632 RepID=UPI0018A80788|nr:serine-rich adhesin for platelets-like [Lucilia sericata]